MRELLGTKQLINGKDRYRQTTRAWRGMVKYGQPSEAYAPWLTSTSLGADGREEIGGGGELGLLTYNPSRLQCQVPSVVKTPPWSRTSRDKEDHSVPVLPTEDGTFAYRAVSEMDWQ